MTNPLIINVRPQLRWHQRLFSDTSTALMWGMWLYLWRPLLVITSAKAISLHPVVIQFFKGSSPISLEMGVSVIISGSIALMMWGLLPSRQVKETSTKTLADYAEHFHIPEAEIIEGRAANICTVYHDEHGRMTHISTNA